MSCVNLGAAILQKRLAARLTLLVISLVLILPVQSLRSASAPSVPFTATWATAPNNLDVNFNNQSIRMILRTTIGGDQVRIRLSNRFGTDSLPIGAAHVALHQQGAAIVPGSDRPLSFGGKTTIVIPPGGYVLSDPVDLKVEPLNDLAVTIYLPGAASHTTGHATGLRTTYVSGPGDFTSAADFPSASTTVSYYWLTGVFVSTKKPARVIVAFGDSITDGARSTPDTNNSWPAILAKLLLSSPKHANTAVLNAGIGGNRVLHDINGPDALARFDADAINEPGVNTIIVLEGINDIGWPEQPNRQYQDQLVTANDLIQGMQQLIARCHMHNIKVVGATLTPYMGAGYFSAGGESTREALNQWIRTSNSFDAVIDFDKATEDPANPGHFLPVYDSGDHLHPNDAGYQAMAAAAAPVLEKMHK